MKKTILFLLIFAMFILMGGCAAGYKSVNPPALEYNSHDLQDGIGLSYKYDVLREMGNRKYSKREYKQGVKVIAIKLTNNTDSTLNINRDIAFYFGPEQVSPMEPLAIKNSIKQQIPTYLPYIFLTLVRLNIHTESMDESFPIGLLLGPAVTFGNMAVAASANKNLFKELIKYHILDKEIKAGESVYGIIGIHENGYNPLSVKIKK
ncbi:MAG: hypothetical protein ACOYN5_02685 [Bacteroidales bacterium]